MRACSIRCFRFGAPRGCVRHPPRRGPAHGARHRVGRRRAAWPELARAIVEADFAAADALTDERQQSRRLLATLRFLRHLVETDAEAELAQAIVQAAAVWFDVDARIFQRDLAGDFVLHTALPGAHDRGVGEAPELALVRRSGRSGSARVRCPSGVNGRPDPKSCSFRCPSAAILTGSSRSSARSRRTRSRSLPVLGRIVGVQLETIRSRRRDRTRERFESLVEQGGAVPELLAVRLVRELADMTRRGYASLVLNRQGRERRIVCIGAFERGAGCADGCVGRRRFSADAVRVHAAARRRERSPTLDLRPATGESFRPDAELVTRVAARVLQSWLVGAEPSLADVDARDRASRPCRSSCGGSRRSSSARSGSISGCRWC